MAQPDTSIEKDSGIYIEEWGAFYRITPGVGLEVMPANADGTPAWDDDFGLVLEEGTGEYMNAVRFAHKINQIFGTTYSAKDF
jgi:hypothetical protein